MPNVVQVYSTDDVASKKRKNKGDSVLAEYPRLKLTGNHNWILLVSTGEVCLISQCPYPFIPMNTQLLLDPAPSIHPSMHVESWCLSTADPTTPWSHSLFQHLAQVLSPDTSPNFTSMRIAQVMTREGAQLTQFSSGFDFGFPLAGNV